MNNIELGCTSSMLKKRRSRTYKKCTKYDMQKIQMLVSKKQSNKILDFVCK